MSELSEVAARMWSVLDGPMDALERLTTVGSRRVLPSVYDVTGLATGAVAAASLAVAELAAVRSACAPPRVTVDSRAACAAFSSERLLEAVGWELPPIWDPIAGDYRASDRWIRLHTNYRAHRLAALKALQLPGDPDRDTVAARVAERTADDVEQAVVDNGGCAAAYNDRDLWRVHPHGSATAGEPPIVIGTAPAGVAVDLPAPDPLRPLAGVRVLDLTRVIAGPVCTRFLAAYGAEVLRIDPPGFEEVPALVPDTSVGKRCTALDLGDARDRSEFERLVGQAHVVVHGLRPGAMERLGLGPDVLRELNPQVLTARHNAYGWTGPWSERRGFDSLVQMSCGIAAAGAEATGADRPVPLPAQALDHATGYLVAAALVRGLAGGGPVDVTASLLGTANVLMAMPDPDGMTIEPPAWTSADTVEQRTEWGPARIVPCPGEVTGRPVRWDVPPGPLGRHDARWPAAVRSTAPPTRAGRAVDRSLKQG